MWGNVDQGGPWARGEVGTLQMCWTRQNTGDLVFDGVWAVQPGESRRPLGTFSWDAAPCSAGVWVEWWVAQGGTRGLKGL